LFFGVSVSANQARMAASPFSQGENPFYLREKVGMRGLKQSAKDELNCSKGGNEK